MFPQSELDNYKLQVELLQEKLQRSEISRQQLEHKLDKILQKRNENEKLARSKAKQKYQQFLEEQQRRNERNKQLVQMLERIEQQTEIMNARSERLKMMKLQYEMYFAKLVHSQTRRCIQNSVAPIGPMMNGTSMQPLAPNATPSSVQQQPAMEGYNYLPNANTPLMSPYSQRYAPAAAAVNFEKEQYGRQQQYFNMPGNEAMLEMPPTLANFTKQQRNDERDLRNESRYEINEPPGKYNQNDMDFNHITNMANNPTMTSSVSSHLLSADKEPADYQDSEKLTTTTTSSTFEEIPNVQMMSSKMQINHNTEKRINPADPISKTNQLPQDMNAMQQPPQSSTVIKSLPKTVTNVNENTKQIRNNIEDATLNKTQVQDMITPPGGYVKPLAKSTEINQTKQAYEIPQNSVVSANNIKTESIEIPKLSNALVNNNNNETNSSSTPVSIENIENAIYGELLSPLETEQEQNQEPVKVVPSLLENLVTQPDPALDTQTNFSLEENAEIKLETTAGLTNNNNETFKEFGENTNNETPPYNQDINPQQNEEQSLSNETDYAAYENADPNTINETQQEQQYDYSNYDPTQYSYPGYIYDETTGEYKPDPNAPPDQYATDQQYATEGYEQQYQQQSAYDYNQTYDQETPANLDNNAYNNYDNAVPQENLSNIPTNDSNLEQQQQEQAQLPYSEIEPQPQLPQQPFEEVREENPAEEQTQPQSQTQLPAKVTKPTSILATTEKNNENQKKKKRVNFVDSSEAEESVTNDKEVALKTKPATTTGGSSESDFDFSSSVEGETKTTT